MHALTTRELWLQLCPRLGRSKEAPKNLLVLFFSAESRTPTSLLRRARSTTVCLLRRGVCLCPSVVWRSPTVRCHSSPISPSPQQLPRFLRLAMAGACELPCVPGSTCAPAARHGQRGHLGAWRGCVCSWRVAGVARCLRGTRPAHRFDQQRVAGVPADHPRALGVACVWPACPRLARASATQPHMHPT
jgi:hypothetical protein